jgi:hypothetical protein
MHGALQLAYRRVFATAGRHASSADDLVTIAVAAADDDV